MKSKSILVVEDEKKILEVIQAYLKNEGFDVLIAEDGENALEIINREQVHLVILDLMLPKISGEDVCRKIRTMSDIPIIMLTARSEEDDKIEGLAIGADDYMTKPFSPRELIGRVRALIRRSYREEQPLADFLSYNHGDLEVDVKRMLVKKNGDILNFTPNEFKLLYVFLVNPGQIFTREQLIEKAFGYDYDGFDRTIDTHIKNIRQKIENDPKNPVYILTVYGMGYKFGGGK
ncbi:MAG: response regulator transcription factor [Anaerosolibacter sp.]|jgi:DNA-binding response OmpR family regulator|uniref:response regulator transcription factor n=1 Tax=Anaerosolibacter sp. TaxID=1872527 RepID=UPI00261570FF|nr:response regulator transcription factor [Anaerosolibacter sp.]MDF2548881.1 response regulator transcription factor [Anaerosolibacter sp.]